MKTGVTKALFQRRGTDREQRLRSKISFRGAARPTAALEKKTGGSASGVALTLEPTPEMYL